MKTAISLPDDLFASTDGLAKRLGMSRSALIAAALTEFIAKHRGAKVSERLNAVYSSEDGRIHQAIKAAQRRAVRGNEEW